jgi:hypothetical protein
MSPLNTWLEFSFSAYVFRSNPYIILDKEIVFIKY